MKGDVRTRKREQPTHCGLGRLPERSESRPKLYGISESSLGPEGGERDSEKKMTVSWGIVMVFKRTLNSSLFRSLNSKAGEEAKRSLCMSC